MTVDDPSDSFLSGLHLFSVETLSYGEDIPSLFAVATEDVGDDVTGFIVLRPQRFGKPSHVRFSNCPGPINPSWIHWVLLTLLDPGVVEIDLQPVSVHNVSRLLVHSHHRCLSAQTQNSEHSIRHRRKRRDVWARFNRAILGRASGAYWGPFPTYKLLIPFMQACEAATTWADTEDKQMAAINKIAHLVAIVTMVGSGGCVDECSAIGR